MKKIGAIYIRVSTDKQEELSPDAQLRLLLEYAGKNNITIPQEFIFQDNGISGRKAQKRPGFQKMIGLAKSKEHPMDCIIVWKFSRFARNQEESILYKSLLKKNAVEVISISENTTGEFGTLIERIIEWMDEYYSIRLSGEVIRGMTENALRGNYQANPPIGYLSGGNKKPPIINPETIAIPQTMKRLFMDERKTSRQIAVYCNTHGWKTKRGNAFDARDVEYILMNPFYAAKVRWNYSDRGRRLKATEEVILVDGNWPALWTYEDTLAMTNAILSKRSSLSQKRKHRDISTCKHWLSGLLVCSNCGHTLAYSGSDDKKGFQCWNYSKGKCTVSHYIGINLISAYVIDGLKSLLQADSTSYEAVKPISCDYNLQLEELNRQFSRLSQREVRAKNAYLDGIDSKEEYKTNKENIKKEQDALIMQIEALTLKSKQDMLQQESTPNRIDNVEDVVSILENETFDFEQKGNALRSIVDYIVFDRTNTLLTFVLKLKL